MQIENKNASIACVLLCTGIALGAMGVHLLKDTISEHYLKTFETGVRYQIYAGLGSLMLSFAGETMKKAFQFIFIGSLIFSGSIYLLAMNEIISSSLKIFGAIAPFGGLIMIVGWALAAMSFWKRK